jgi:hypothetical protein
MYIANVYNVFIASPSDVVSERDYAEEILHEWNSLNSRKMQITLQPIRWEKNVYSEFSTTPQEIINKQILEDADILIAIFHSKIGSPTKDYESGTVEELKNHIQNNKPAMVFFSKEPVEQNNINHEQWKLLKAFKEWCKSQSVYCEYSSKEKFKEIFRSQITLLLNRFPANSDIDIQKKNNYTQTKEDAINFISRIPSFNENFNLLEQYFEEIGNYRSLQLNPFFETTGLLKLLGISDGTFRIQLRPTMRGFSNTDIDNFIQDVKDGRYNEYLS